MKKVLFIAYNYPPGGGSGVQRGAKFARYLPDYGWEPIILTPDYHLLKQARDYSLARELPKNQIIYRSFTLDARWLFKLLWGLRLHKLVNWLNFHVFIPDPELLWLPFAKAKLSKIMKLHKPDLVFISGPPFSPMLLGTWIKDKYAIPYVVSFRDDWSLGQSRLDNIPPKRFTAKDRHFEHLVLTKANHVVTTNRAYKNDFLALYPELPEAHYTVITNGYDETDFSPRKAPPRQDRKFMHIVYPGALYGRRNPAKIWQALHELVLSQEIDPSRIRIDIYGQNYRSFVFSGIDASSQVNQIVQLHPYLPHHQAIEALLQADLLLLFSGPGPKSDVVIPGKLFEYMRSGRPVLAVINPQGVCAEIFSQARSGLIANSASVSDIKDKLLQLYRQWEAGKLQIEPDWDYIKQFERRQLTSRLASCFDEVLKQR